MAYRTPKKILFIAATHGDETIGIEVLQKLSEKETFDWVVGNPEALRRGTRYYEKDLNRSAPGNVDSVYYEKRRAAELITLSTKYSATIDIHGTDCPCGIVMLITNPTKQNLALAASISIGTIVIWPSITPEMKCPPSEFFLRGLEIECGNQKNAKTAEELELVLNEFLQSAAWNNKYTDTDLKKRLQTKKIYQMYGSLKKKKNLEKELEEMKPCTINGETYTPVFLGTYPYKDILGYKLKLMMKEEITTMIDSAH